MNGALAMVIKQEESDKGVLSIPSGLLSIMGVLLMQTGAGIWWMAGVGKDVDNIRASASALRAESYTRVEAQLQIQRLDQMDAAFGNKLQELVGRVEQIAATQRRTEAIVMENSSALRQKGKQ